MTKNYNTLEVTGQNLQLDSIFGTDAGMALVDTEGIFIKVNAALCRFLGYEEEELLGGCAGDVVHPEDLSRLRRHYRDWTEDGTDILHIENRYLHKSGHVLRGMARLSKMPVIDTFLVVIHLTDLTLAARREEQDPHWEIMKNLYHLNSNPLVVVDLEGNVIKVNSAYEELFGYSKEEMLGRPLPTIPLSFLRHNLAGFNDYGETPYKTEFETVNRTKDGRLISVYIKLFPICDETGKMRALGRVVKDITEQGVLTSQLHDLVAFNLDPMLIFNPSGYVVQSNQAFTEQFGWPLERVVDYHWSRLPFISVEQNPDLKQLVDKVVDHRIVTGFETVLLKENGETVQISLTGFPLKYGRNGTGGTAVILRDITREKKAEQLMLKSEKLSLAGQLAAAIAHEIRNPITSIKGFLKLLENSERKEHYFEIVNSEIDRIEQILSEMLVLAKPQTVKFESKNIRQILDQVLSLLGGEANMNGIEILLHDFTEQPEVYCDENQIKQVFINFMKNAMEAMPEGGTLTIELFQTGAADKCDLKIIFTDTGLGIPPELLAKIGEPFFTTKQKGTGLGFMTSKNIVENHNGKLSITSKLNEGTSIEIRFPSDHPLNIS